MVTEASSSKSSRRRCVGRLGHGPIVGAGCAPAAGRAPGGQGALEEAAHLVAELRLGQLDVERRGVAAHAVAERVGQAAVPGGLVGDRREPVVGEQRAPGAGVGAGQLVQGDGALEVRPANPPVRRTVTSVPGPASAGGGGWAAEGARRLRSPSGGERPGVDGIRDPDGVPGRADGGDDLGALAVAGRGGGDGEPGEGREVAVGADVAGDRVEPDLAGDLPGVAAEGGREDVEGLVGDAGVDVDPAVVVGGVDVVAQVRRLRVRAERGSS